MAKVCLKSFILKNRNVCLRAKFTLLAVMTPLINRVLCATISGGETKPENGAPFPVFRIPDMHHHAAKATYIYRYMGAGSIFLIPLLHPRSLSPPLLVWGWYMYESASVWSLHKCGDSETIPTTW